MYIHLSVNSTYPSNTFVLGMKISIHFSYHFLVENPDTDISKKAPMKVLFL